LQSRFPSEEFVIENFSFLLQVTASNQIVGSFLSDWIAEADATLSWASGPMEVLLGTAAELRRR
jgi:hypothetical protein